MRRRTDLDREGFQRRGRRIGRCGRRGHDRRHGRCRCSESARGRRKRVELDQHQASHRHHVVQGKNIVIPHADATIARGLSYQSLLIRSVDVDPSTVGIVVLFFEPAQPEDPSQQAIVAGRASLFQADSLPGIVAMVEFATQWNSLTDLVLHHEPAERRSKAVRLVSQAETRGGNRESVRGNPVLNHLEGLILHAHPDDGRRLVVRRGDATREKDREGADTKLTAQAHASHEFREF